MAHPIKSSKYDASGDNGSRGSDDPQLYIIRLPQTILQQTQQLSFRQPWYIDDSLLLTVPPPSKAGKVSGSSIQLKTNDLLYFPDCLTGAGEFEGCYFVGSREAPMNNKNEYFRLLRASIEHPVFPEQVIESALGTSILALKGDGGQELSERLRQMYEPLFERILKEQADLSMVDLMGGKDVLEEYWSCPDIGKDLSEKSEQSSRQSIDEEAKSYYIIALQCTSIIHCHPHERT